MRSPILAFAAVLALSGAVWAQSATELKKEILPKLKKAQAEGKDVSEAQEAFNEGDKALKDGMQDEAVEAFKKAKAALPE